MDKSYWLSKIKKASRIEKFQSIVDRCENKVVLDVGCVGQDHSEDEHSWLHGRIKKVATELIGSDINQEAIASLRKKGFEIFTPDELDVDKKVDIVVMGDVIEHVNDPGAFLEFYSRFLKEDGEIIICTPNSFGARYSLSVFFFGNAGTNPEHTLSFDPYVMLELFSRVGLEPKEFYWLKEYSKPRRLSSSIVFGLARILVALRSFFNSNFMYIVKKA